MPPPARVCLGCKGSKTSCVGFSPSTPCKRCVRLGLVCIAAPQRSAEATRKLMKPATRQLLASNHPPHAFPPAAAAPLPLLTPPSPAAVPLPLLPCRALPAEACIAGEMIATPAASLRALLRSWARIARQRNGYALLSYVLYLCQKAAIPLDDVLGAGFFTPPALPPPPPPPPPAALPSAEYALTRTCLDGALSFSTNATFEERVCTVAEMKACWERNAAEVTSLFVHPDDGAVLYRAVGRLFAQLTEEGAVERLRADESMRLYDRVLCRYVRCELYASIAWLHDGQSERITFEWSVAEAAGAGGGASEGWALEELEGLLGPLVGEGEERFDDEAAGGGAGDALELMLAELREPSA